MMARTRPTPLYETEEEGTRQAWVPSSYQYGPHRCTCRPGAVCAACRTWPQTKRLRQQQGPQTGVQGTRRYSIRTLRWAGVIEVDAAGTILTAPATMPPNYHQCRSWEALTHLFAKKYKHLQIREVRADGQEKEEA